LLGANGIELSQEIGSVTTEGQVVNVTASLSHGEYTFLIIDFEADGICCDVGIGYYNLTLNGVPVGDGDRFVSFVTITFTVPGATIPAAVSPNINASVVVIYDEDPIETGWILIGKMGTILIQEAKTVSTQFTTVSKSALVSR
jgi:hypothetical protein